MTRHQRLRLLDVDVVEVELPFAPDLERVGEARRRDQPRRRALPFDQRVGEQRGGVDDARDAQRIDRGLAQQRRDAARHRARRIVVRREHLLAPLAAAVVIVDDQVGEGAADVDAERMAGHAVTS